MNETKWTYPDGRGYDLSVVIPKLYEPLEGWDNLSDLKEVEVVIDGAHRWCTYHNVIASSKIISVIVWSETCPVVVEFTGYTVT